MPKIQERRWLKYSYCRAPTEADTCSKAFNVVRLPVNPGIGHRGGKVVNPAGIHKLSIDSFGDDS